MHLDPGSQESKDIGGKCSEEDNKNVLDGYKGHPTCHGTKPANLQVHKDSIVLSKKGAALSPVIHRMPIEIQRKCFRWPQLIIAYSQLPCSRVSP